MTKAFQLTVKPNGTLDQTNWPDWLHAAWEREWGKPGSFEPMHAPHDGFHYIAHGTKGSTHIRDAISVTDLL